MQRKPLQNIDPSIRRVAQQLIVEAMDGIEELLLADGTFYKSRAIYLEANAGRWVRQYGQECADMAVRGLCALERDEMLSKPAKATLREMRKAECLRNLRLYDPGRDNAVNRWFVRWFAMRLYALVAAVLAFSALYQGPAAAVEVAPRFKALALCGTLKPGPARDRACAPFNTVERGSYRDWDGPRGPAPRDWEMPRDWEVERH